MANGVLMRCGRDHCILTAEDLSHSWGERHRTSRIAGTRGWLPSNTAVDEPYSHHFEAKTVVRSSEASRFSGPRWSIGVSSLQEVGPPERGKPGRCHLWGIRQLASGDEEVNCRLAVQPDWDWVAAPGMPNIERWKFAGECSLGGHCRGAQFHGKIL